MNGGFIIGKSLINGSFSIAMFDDWRLDPWAPLISTAVSQAVGPKGYVIAFEPFRWLHQLVVANVAINGSLDSKMVARPPGHLKL